MKRALSMLAVAVLVSAGYGCKNPMGGGDGGGGGGGAWKPDKCFDNAYMGDMNDLKEGRWVTYATEASGTKTMTTWKVLCKCANGWCIEHWMDMGSMAYGFLYCVGDDGKVKKAWAAAKGDKKWTEIKVEPAPSGQGGGDAPKPEITMSDEDKEVKAGKFACKKVHVKMTVSGNTYESDSWYSKDVWQITSKSEHGGMVAMEAQNMKMWLDGKGEDGKATMEMPK